MSELDTPSSSPIWRDLSSQQLRELSARFSVTKGTKTLQVVEALADCGFEDVLSVQISSRHSVIVTFCDRGSLDRIVREGFVMGEDTIVVENIIDPALRLSISDIPIWISDNAILAALTPYGVSTTSVRHGVISTKNGNKIATGVRYVTFKLAQGVTAVPSYLKTAGGSTFSVRYDGQPRTCRICHSPDHLQADCPSRTSGSAASGGTGTRATRTQSYADSVLGSVATGTVSLQQQSRPTTEDARELVQQENGTATAPSQQQSGSPLSQATDGPTPPNESSKHDANQQAAHAYATQDVLQDMPTPPPQEALPSHQTTPAFPRGKSSHHSPDDNDGFTLAAGKHAFKPRVRTHTPLTAVPPLDPRTQRVLRRRSSQ